MAMTPAERKRQQRQRQKDKQRESRDGSYPFLKEPFHQWLEKTEGYGDWSSAEAEMNLAGLELPLFEDDEGPRPFDDAFGDDIEKYYPGYERSIGRAEALVGNLIGAASSIALVINRYKKEELNLRIKELEESDLDDPEARKRAFDDIVRLRKMLDRLNRTKRVTFHEWELKNI